MPIFSRNASVLAERKPVVVDGNTYFKSEWMDSGRAHEFSPHVFLVEQAPHVSLRTHFHRENQFQLFVRGSGRLGPHPIEALTVHYAGAYSGYGPLVSGREGLAYFTLRTIHETGSLTMAQHGEQMRRGPKRNLYSKAVTITDTDRLHRLSEPSIEDLITLQPDRIAARLHTLPPRIRSVAGLDPTGSAGQFWVVLAGSLQVGERQLDPWESLFVRPDDPSPELVATEQGSQLVCLQLAAKVAAYR